MSLIQPKISFLGPDQIQQVHEHTLDLLDSTGIRVDATSAQHIFRQAGAEVQGDRVRLPAPLVESAIKTVPQQIQIFDQQGSHSFALGRGEALRFGLGVTNTAYQNPDTDRIEPFSLKHARIACQLGDFLDQFDLVSTPGVPTDGEHSQGELQVFVEMLANTSKPLIVLISEPAQFSRALDLLTHLFGDLADHPFVIPYFNPISPLVLNEDTTSKMETAIGLGLPVIFSSYGMSGATSPITGLGTLVQLNAELLAGLTFAQAVKPGTPMILGSLPAIFDMKYMTSGYTSQTYLLNLACSNMMNHYNIPHAGTSGSGAGWGADLSAAGGQWLNHLLSSLGASGLAPFVGGNFDSLVFSPALVIYANEVIRQIRQLTRGMALDWDEMHQANFHQVGPGGSFLTSPQTLEKFMDLQEELSSIWPGYPLEQWQALGSPSAPAIFQERVMQIMNGLEAPPHAAEIRDRSRAWFADRGFSLED